MYDGSKKSSVVGNLGVEFSDPSGEVVSGMVLAFEGEGDAVAGDPVDVSSVVRPSCSCSVCIEAAFSKIVYD